MAVGCIPSEFRDEMEGVEGNQGDEAAKLMQMQGIMSEIKAKK